MRGEPLACSREQPRAQPDALAFGPEVELVDLTLLLELARPIAADGGVARYSAADLDDQHRRGAPDRVLPPQPATAVDHRGERPVRDDSRIGVLPSVAMHLSDCVRVAGFGLADIDNRGGHNWLTIRGGKRPHKSPCPPGECCAQAGRAEVSLMARSELDDVIVELVHVAAPQREVLGQQCRDRGDRLHEAIGDLAPARMCDEAGDDHVPGLL